MARSRVPIQEDPSSDDDLYDAPSRTLRVPRTATMFSPSSDKENASAFNAKTSKGSKGKEVDRSGGGGGRLAELSPTQTLHNKVLEEEGDKDAYDPDQDPEERRQVKKEYRELQRKLNDSKAEYLQPNSTGLFDTFVAVETLFTRVKQTADATIDSRLLVQATDLALKKATSLTYGTSGIGIDADEFVGKCISFMRNNSEARRNRLHNDEEEDGPNDDAMDWAYLGREAAFKGNKRPATTDFLLGPLSVTKKIRVVKARRQALRRDNANLVRPVEVTQDPNTRAENNASTMSTLVKNIYDGLKATFRRNPVYNEDGLNLFRFVINPDSFGQTIENIFYLSFLVKDGFVAITESEDTGLPVIYCSEPPTQDDHKDRRITRNQVIFSMTMWEWQEVKRVFDITESMIPTRAQEQKLTSATGWYS